MLSFEFVLCVALSIAFGLLLHRTSFGRRVFAIGNNPTAALFSGIDMARHRMILFVLTALMSGLASVLLTSRLGSTRPNIATSWELEIITIAVLGGVNINGGAGTVPGVFIAAVIIGFLTYGMGLVNMPGIEMTGADRRIADRGHRTAHRCAQAVGRAWPVRLTVEQIASACASIPDG